MSERRIFRVEVREIGGGFLVTVPELPEVTPFGLRKEQQAEDAARYYIAKALAQDPTSFDLQI
jgi:predicted RNase H-like HicB family nuclease